MQNIQSQTWPVPVPCPHNEVAFNAVLSWCETCGAVLSGGPGVRVHPSDHTVCGDSPANGDASREGVCGHGEWTVVRDAREWIGVKVR